jgi:hypothetical protein
MCIALLLLLLLLPLPLSVHAEDLGELSANPFIPESTSNPFGAGVPIDPTVPTTSMGVAGELRDGDEKETATLGMFFMGWTHKVLRIPPK